MMERKDQADTAYILAIMDDALPLAVERINAEPAEAHVFSERSQRDAERFLESLKSVPAKKARTWAKVAVFLVAMTLLLPLTVEAARTQVMLTVREFADHWQIVFNNDESTVPMEPESFWDDTVSSYRPIYWPEGFIEIASGAGVIEYAHDDGRSILFLERSVEAVSPSYDKDDYLITEMTIVGNKAWMMESLIPEKGNQIIWIRDDAVYSLYGYVPACELHMMAESARED